MPNASPWAQVCNLGKADFFQARLHGERGLGGLVVGSWVGFRGPGWPNGPPSPRLAPGGFYGKGDWLREKRGACTLFQPEDARGVWAHPEIAAGSARSEPDVKPAVEHVGNLLGEHAADAFVGVAGREVGGDHDLVVKPLPAGQQVVEVDVAVLVDLFLAV